jgi:hypothetical protein
VKRSPQRFRLAAALCLLLVGTAGAGDVVRNQSRVGRVADLTVAEAPPDGVLRVGLSRAAWSVRLGSPDRIDTADVTGLRLDLDYSPLHWVRLWGGIPRLSWSADDPDVPASVSGFADGVAGLVLYAPAAPLGLRFALDLRRPLPLGDETSGLGDGGGGGYYGLALTRSFWRFAQTPELRVHLNAGRRATARDGGRYARAAGLYEPWPGLYPAVLPGGDAADNDPLVLGVAVEVRKSLVSLSAGYAHEVYGDGADIGPREEPRRFTAGVCWGGETGWALDAAYVVPLGRDDPATTFSAACPDWLMRVGLSYAWPLGGRDRDHDGVVDRIDVCPNVPEDRDGFRDEDGCPDPDNDEDGVPDIEDLAPDVPEDLDGWKDQDGVPDNDNDGDGIPDLSDDCPNMAEDFDGYQDEDGCPEEFLDADNDGVADDADLCPGRAEDLDGWEDGDGCPDLDNDLDGIPDAQDACPDLAEDYDGVADDDGCPE